MNKFNILISSAGRRVELVRSFQDSVKRLSLNAKIICTDIEPDFSSACQISDLAVKVPRVNSSDYIKQLLEICKLYNVGMIVPTIDTELLVLSKNRDIFELNGINIVVSDYQLVSDCRDKRATANVFSSLDIDQPEIYDVNSIVFPCFCKPYDGSCSIGAFPLYHEMMLTPEILANEKNMFMELVDSDYCEYTVDAYYNIEGILCCVVPRERIEVRGGEVSKGITRKDFVYAYLCSRLGRISGARGCITFQFFVNVETQSLKALEINPRFGGGYPLTHSAGAPYSEWLIREYFLGEKIDFFDSWTANLLMLRYDASVLVYEE
ncbi:ATP-grasp domain-containing protein [Thalassolituus oleivorans]|uniref:ATP-grasp domain-containing protein n=1 Tax=Thalassolituus oleivorans TaxID=187493 RepID=UPI002409C79D|nr:ATP-grasp domain-containing protein [Thalassolituus oleivorans]MDF1641268.1 ATP-grasp domain-containing protein [Thalassolituus oleivorans]